MLQIKYEKLFQFESTKHWRFYFHLIEHRILVEISGGPWSGGRKGMLKDKAWSVYSYDVAASMGYTVIRLESAPRYKIRKMDHYRSKLICLGSQAKAICKKDWWDKLGADQLHQAIVFQIWDFAVNAGKSRAVKELQQAVGVSDDGIIGPKTIVAVKAKDVNDVLLLLVSERLRFYTSLPTWSTYGKGWTNRVADNLKYAAEDD